MFGEPSQRRAVRTLGDGRVYHPTPPAPIFVSGLKGMSSEAFAFLEQAMATSKSARG